MRIWLSTVFVQDQATALEFYTTTLGFVKKSDVSLGKYRWLTVTSPDEPQGAELLLEPNENQAARTYQAAIYAQRIPAAMFQVKDLEGEVARLQARGVKFTQEVTGPREYKIAVFDDTCGNLIQLIQLG